jgi:AraC family transcriptional regulator
MHAHNSAHHARPTIEEWHDTAPVQALRTSLHQGWEQVRMITSRLEPTCEEQVSPQFSDYNLLMVLEGTSRRNVRIGSESPIDDVMTPGTLQIHPPHLETIATWDAPQTMSFLELPVQTMTLLADEAFRGDPHHIQLDPQLNFQDSLLQALVEALCTELNNENAFGVLYAESINQTIMVHLLHRYGKLTPISIRPHLLSPEQIRCLNEYLDAHLTEKIQLSDLAGLLHISISHFERMFRATFDRSPYQYVIDQRVERARQLLCGTPFSLQDVALMCGFANQSHMTRHFSRIVGVTPAHFAKYSRR